MPFAVQNIHRTKCNERQKRELHEQEYLKYVSNLSRQSFNNKNMFHIAPEHLNEIEHARVRNLTNRNIQYERINQQNRLLSERFFKSNRQAIVDHRNAAYQQNLDTFSLKHKQQRSNDYKRINEENKILMKRFQSASTRLVPKQQCEQDWQQHIVTMKKSCEYPDRIDEFVSNTKKNQHTHMCPWYRRLALSRSTENSFALLA